MGIPLLALHSETSRDQFPLLMERLEDHEGHQHVIDIVVVDAPSSISNQAESHDTVDRPSSSTQQTSSPQSSSGRNSSGNPSYVGRVILSLSRYKSSDAPLFAWVVGYACGCLATLPILYWRLRNCSRGRDRFSVQAHQSSSESVNAEATVSTSPLNQEVNSHDNSRIVSRNSQMRRRISVRLNGVVDHFKMALDCFFAVWFVVGNVWIFGAHSSPSVAPKLYRLCIVFLTFSCIGYALPFLLCATIFCCLPCIISVMGIREDLSKPRGASIETIDALPTYKFKSRKNGSIDDEQICLKASKDDILADGAQNECVISGEDALCCICLAAYVDNDELRELPCTHLFHTECVDKWLKINASCPLCKLEIGEDRTRALSSGRNNSMRQNVDDEGDLSLTSSNNP
ncbi:E3 ubiquitin-protein ligase At1g63170-like isoform X2 [Chenopodium quinoa]|uniref:E3 ubiquitin-protein ligase At1g63170-like isoform X2 n=1 Tax=Chenopodium quinoa TaxID=63459 RepID=UPI000B779166|nr:E3 ubiquitin-protein ligase At1g63170-like isoform X2 [Chenopodium quinoa]